MISKTLVLTLALLALVLPAGAGASSRQFTILQDDGNLLNQSGRNKTDAMSEAKSLGVDMVRTFVVWDRVSPRPNSKRKPRGFDVGNPNSKGYDWSYYDKYVEEARRNKLKVFFTLSPPLPDWASENPGFCPHLIGGYSNLGRSCYWKPKPKVFGQFAEAVARRYRGKVDLWSVWNEPNLEHYLYPQRKGPRAGTGKVDLGAKRYRELWYEAWKGIARRDPARRGKVLFGETAAISSPLDTLYGALCLDEDGNPFRGRMRALQGCSNPRRLPIGGIAVHPYNADATGTVFDRPATFDSTPMSALYRVHQLTARAVRFGRIPRSGRGVYITEFGFQSNPPDRERGLGLTAHARALNQSDRLFARDRRVRSVAQFELYDAVELKEQDIYNTGLRFISGKLKPAWRAFRMPLVVTKISSDKVEVWGHVRPARGRARPSIFAASRGRRFSRVRRVTTNPSGIFRVVVRRRGASRLRWQTRWLRPASVDGYMSSEELRSRVASAGRKIRYLR